MKLIDTHFHLDFYRDHKLCYEYINNSKQYTLCVTNSPEIFYSCKKMYPETKYLKFALGYNPKTVVNNAFNKRLFNFLLDQTRYIGEIGLDFSGELKNHRNTQIECFDYICSAISKEHILNIHSKKAEKDVFSILQKNKVKKAIIHWYSGDLTTLHQLLDEGYYFSINSNMINSVKGQIIISQIPLNRILIESDGPFTKVNSQKYSPSQLQEVYRQVAALLKSEDIEELIWNNFKTLLL